MRVTVWRHGEAGVASRDEDRPLTERGRTSLSAAIQEYQVLCEGVAPTLIHYSPLLRTAQTAAIIGQHFPDATAEICDELAPGTELRDHRSFLTTDDVAHLLLVTHQPFVSELIWYWLDDKTVPALAPGGFCIIDLQAPTCGGAILLHVVPDILG